jgi:hypothetical protein
MYENLCGNLWWQLCRWNTVDISLTVHRRAILKIVKLICNVIIHSILKDMFHKTSLQARIQD